MRPSLARPWLSWRRTLAIALLVLAGFTGTIRLVHADPATFYTPPQPLPPGVPGDVIRTEPMTFVLDPVFRVPVAAAAQRIMYRSTDLHGDPIAMTATLLVPDRPWPGPGPRPLVSLAAGTQGGGDQCAPSREMEAGTFYEGFAVVQLLLRGWAVVLIDYRGLGPPGVHTMLNRVDAAHAMLDAARAAQRILGPGPVGIGGYSQGGQAAAAAAELQPTYAPDLDLVGVYAGAVPADLSNNGGRAETATDAVEIGWLVDGLIEAYPDRADAIRDLFNADGVVMLDTLSRQCGFDTLFTYGATDTRQFTRDGRPISDHLDEEPIASLLAQQRVGSLRPDAPVLLVASSNDDSVPAAQTRQLAREWSARGASVRYLEVESPPLLPGSGIAHFVGSLPAHIDGADFLAQQFAAAE